MLHKVVIQTSLYGWAEKVTYPSVCDGDSMNNPSFKAKMDKARTDREFWLLYSF